VERRTRAWASLRAGPPLQAIDPEHLASWTSRALRAESRAPHPARRHCLAAIAPPPLLLPPLPLPLLPPHQTPPCPLVLPSRRLGAWLLAAPAPPRSRFRGALPPGRRERVLVPDAVRVVVGLL
jgi:hypothetical protein